MASAPLLSLGEFILCRVSSLSQAARNWKVKKQKPLFSDNLPAMLPQSFPLAHLLALALVTQFWWLLAESVCSPPTTQEALSI